MVLALGFAALLVQDLPQFPPVEDTFIDSQDPDRNFGREQILAGGPGKVILLRFPHFNIEPLAGRRVSDARIVLTLNRLDGLNLVGVSRVTSAWFEGGGRRTAPPGIAQETGATWNHRISGPTGVKWARGGALGDGEAVAIPGAMARVEDRHVIISGLGSAVQAAFEDPLSHHGFRLQFAEVLSFFSGEARDERPRLEIDFLPSATAGPDLEVLSLEPLDFPTDEWPSEGQQMRWVARLRNIGDAPAQGVRAVFRMEGRSDLPQISPATIPQGGVGTVEVTLPWRSDPVDRRRVTLGASFTTPGDSDPSNNSISVPMNGVAVRFASAPEQMKVLSGILGGTSPERFLQRVIADVNHRLLSQSRYSFAPQGITERVRLASLESGAHITIDVGQAIRPEMSGMPQPLALAMLSDLLARRVIGGLAGTSINDAVGTAGNLPDTRDDGPLGRVLPIPSLGWYSPAGEEFGLFETHLISIGEAARIQAGIGLTGEARGVALRGMVPSSVFLRCHFASGQPLAGAEIRVATAQGQEVYAGKTPAMGGVLVPGVGQAVMGLDDQSLIMTATLNGMTETATIPAWRLWAEVGRGNLGAAPLEVRFNIASGALELANIAKNRIVTDSENQYPAALVGLVDDNPATSATFAGSDGSGWIEIDLGRDRPIGEVRISWAGTAWDKFDIVLYKTAQKPSDAALWFREVDSVLQLKQRGVPAGSGTSITYRAPSIRARYVRIVPKSAGPATIADVALLALRAGAESP